jgi:hypothetical protein
MKGCLAFRRYTPLRRSALLLALLVPAFAPDLDHSILRHRLGLHLRRRPRRQRRRHRRSHQGLEYTLATTDACRSPSPPSPSRS